MLRPVHRQAVAAPPLTAATAGCAAPRTGLPRRRSAHAVPALQPVPVPGKETTPCPRRPHPRRARHAPAAPSANGSAPGPPGAARPHRPIRRTRTSGIRTALIAGVLALIVLVSFIAQNAQALKLSFLGAQVRLSAGVALLPAAIAGAPLMAAAGTARITQLRRAIHRTRRGRPPAPATPGGQPTAPGNKEQRPC